MTAYSTLPFVVISFSAYRLTRFLTTDTIPFSHLRNWLTDRWADTIWVDGLTCSWCLGAYVSFALVAGLAQVISIPLPILYALAVSSAVGIISRYAED